MNRISATLVPSLIMLLGTTATYTQDGPISWVPMEIYGCNFLNDSDMDDLNTVVDTWNEWMDENGVGDYAAFILSPFYTPAEFPYDVLWLGLWQDGAAMGGLQQWVAGGGEVQDDFDDVVECPLHLGMVTHIIRQPQEATNIFPVEIADCTLKEGRTVPEARNGLVQWTDYLTENGSDSGHWIVLPGVGESAGATYSFKWVQSYASYDSLGRDFELFFNRGGDQRFNAFIGRMMTCDYPVLYNVRNIRAMVPEAEIREQ